jgi:hypothetical protein
MTSIEDRLRDALRAGADMVQPQTLTARSRTARRSGPAFTARLRLIAPLAAAAAVAASVLFAMLPGHSPAPHPAPPGAGTHQKTARAITFPAYTVINLGAELSVVRTRTGAQVGELRAPRGQQFADVSTGGTAHSFLAATSASPPGNCRAHFYRFQLSSTGQPSGLTLLRSVPDSTPSAVAASPGGGTYAYSTVACTAAAAGGISISGQDGNRAWAYDEGDDYGVSLAMPADGSAIAFSYYNAAGFSDVLLNTRSRAPTVDGASSTLRLSGVSNTLAMSPDGSTLYACLPGSHGDVLLTTYHIATGRRSTVTRHLGITSSPRSTCQLATDPTGRFLLVALQASPPDPAMLGGVDLGSGRFVKLPIQPASLPYQGGQVAWGG